MLNIGMGRSSILLQFPNIIPIANNIAKIGVIIVIFLNK